MAKQEEAKTRDGTQGHVLVTTFQLISTSYILLSSNKDII